MPRSPQTAALLALGAVLLLSCLGCATSAPFSLRQAQDAFDAAVAAEARQRDVAEASTGALLDDVAAISGYRIALSQLDSALGQYSEPLRSDGLLGTALLLRALCLWRLADLEASADRRAAFDQAVSALRQDDALQLGTRDRVLAAALPGLRDHDRGLRAGDATAAAAFFRSAVNTLERSLADVGPPADHPIRSYIRLAQLASLREWAFVSDDDAATRQRLNHCFYTVARSLGELSSTQLRSQVRAFAEAFGMSWPRQPAAEDADPDDAFPGDDVDVDRRQCDALLEAA